MISLFMISLVPVGVLLFSIFLSGPDFFWGLFPWTSYDHQAAAIVLTLFMTFHIWDKWLTKKVRWVFRLLRDNQMALSAALMYLSSVVLLSTMILPSLNGEYLGFAHRTIGSPYMAFSYLNQYYPVIIPLAALAPLSLIPLATKRPSLSMKLAITYSLFAVFWLFRANTMIGDGCTIGFWIDGFTRRPTSMMTRYLFLLAYRHLGQYGFDQYTAISLVSCLAGAAYIYFLYSLTELLDMGYSRRLFFFCFISTAGFSQFLFGWIEEYMVLLAGFMAFLWAAISHLKGRTPIVVPAFIFSLTCMFHVSAILYSPLLLLLAVWRLRGCSRSFALMVSVLLIIAVILPAVIFLGVMEYEGRTVHKYLISKFYSDVLIKQDPDAKVKRHHFLSEGHMSMMANVLLVSSPQAFPLLAVLLLFSLRRIRRWDNVLILLLGASALSIIHLLFITPGFDIRIDWDQYAVSILPVTMAAAYVFSKHSSQATFRRVGPIIMMVNLMHLAPMVIENYVENASFCRAKMFRHEMNSILEGLDIRNALKTYLL